jgi:hypothetical protein
VWRTRYDAWEEKKGVIIMEGGRKKKDRDQKQVGRNEGVIEK